MSRSSNRESKGRFQASGDEGHNCLHGVVHGRVQGVGYRLFARDAALRNGVKGWVRNLPGGQVEVYAEGDELDLMEFLTELHRGPVMAHVTDIEVDWRRTTPSHRRFDIVR